MTFREDNIFKGYQSLEDWLFAQSDDSFPPYDHMNGEKSYPDKYKDMKNALIPIHKIVEKGALIKSISNWKKEIKDQIEKLEKDNSQSSNEELIKLKLLLQRDPAIYLNQHGVGHVDQVIKKVFELICYFKCGFPTPSEVFLLLCAIQAHDIGNIFGREGHERNSQRAMIDAIRPIISDTPTRILFLKIAQVHSGNINGDRDTISKLRANGKLFNKPIREPLLAALLRFGDELADDSSRADLKALDLGIISEESIIYHEYSKSLHAVSIEKNEINQTLYLSLEYYIDSNMVTRKFLKDGNLKLLIDEIFERTIKIEQERRYCMRFLSQYLPLVEIQTRIEIFPSFDFSDEPDMVLLRSPEESLSLTNCEVVTYSLKENGYPSHEIKIDCQDNTGEKVIAKLREKGWRLN